MNSVNDQQLLRDYAERRSETAFAELVRRNVDLVYSAALRLVRDAHLAEDVTQGVFLALAHNAGQLADRPSLSGWLHGTTRNLAANAVRSEVRRHAREQEAAAMNELLAAEPGDDWQRIAPNLDAALGELSESDREVLLLRYFKNQSLREVGQTLGTSEDAAQKRVSRAVDQLRGFLAKRGVRVGTSGLVVAVAANAVQAAPVGLAVTISTAAALAGTTVAATVSTTATNALAMTTLQKAIIGATLVAAVGTGIYEVRQASILRAQVQTLQQQQAPLTEQIRQLSQAFAEATNQIATLHEDNGRLNRNTAELLKLRGELTRLRGESKELAQLKAGDFEKTNNLTEVAVRKWLARLTDLIQRIEQMPETKIPEFQFLTATDWLDVAINASLDTDSDVHNAAQILGALAKDEFAKLMKAALNKFIEANAGELPTEIAQLKPFFPGPVEDGVLQRYEVLRSGNVKDVPELDRSFRLVAERRFAPVGSGRPIVLVGTNGYLRTGQ